MITEDEICSGSKIKRDEDSRDGPGWLKMITMIKRMIKMIENERLYMKN